MTTVGLNTERPLEVYGPGKRRILEPVFGGGDEPPIINEGINESPNTKEMTQYLFQANAQTMNNVMRDTHWADFRETLRLHDIDPYEMNIPGFIDANQTPAPDMDPFLVYSDELVRVSATLVNHEPVFPSFAYRFDTHDGRSVVFSGDTGPSRNLIRMARGADVLVHEVFDAGYIDLMFPNPGPAEEGMINHMKVAHTMIEEVGPVAEEAGARRLVLSHIGRGTRRWGACSKPSGATPGASLSAKT